MLRTIILSAPQFVYSLKSVAAEMQCKNPEVG